MSRTMTAGYEIADFTGIARFVRSDRHRLRDAHHDDNHDDYEHDNACPLRRLLSDDYHDLQSVRQQLSLQVRVRCWRRLVGTDDGDCLSRRLLVPRDRERGPRRMWARQLRHVLLPSVLRNDLDDFHDNNYRSLCEELPLALDH